MWTRTPARRNRCCRSYNQLGPEGGKALGDALAKGAFPALQTPFLRWIRRAVRSRGGRARRGRGGGEWGGGGGAYSTGSAARNARGDLLRRAPCAGVGAPAHQRRNQFVLSSLGPQFQSARAGGRQGPRRRPRQGRLPGAPDRGSEVGLLRCLLAGVARLWLGPEVGVVSLLFDCFCFDSCNGLDPSFGDLLPLKLSWIVNLYV